MIFKIIFVILKLALIGWIYAKIAKIDEESYSSHNSNQLTPPKYIKMIGFLTSIVWGIVAYIIIITPTSVNKTATWQMALFFGLIALFGLYMLWSYAICRHSYDDKGLTYTNTFNKKKFLAWQDIDKIEYSSTWTCIILISKTGEKFYITDNMVGLDHFLQILHDKVPHNE